MHSIIEQHRDSLETLCKSCHVSELYFFGSVVNTDTFTAESDIDILVNFKEDLSLEVYTDSYFNLLFALEELLHREIDITTFRSVKNPFFKAELERTKVLFYSSTNTVAVDG